MYQIKDPGSSSLVITLLIIINLYAHHLGFYDIVKVADN